MAKKKIFIGLSGGVDSAVAGLLLKRRFTGCQLVAVYGRFYREGSFKNIQKLDLRSAQRVANQLKIPFCQINLIKEFKERVVDNYLSEYQQGRTPNPCIVCNRELKFGLLKDKVFQLGADKFATGHYLKLENGSVYRAKDKSKDQSYFLSALKRSQLKDLLFPLADYSKTQVIELARQNQLPVYERDQSRGICFYPKDGHQQFMKKHARRSIEPGEILNSKGKVIGRHQGVACYTIGQRIGAEVDPVKAGFKGISPPPQYVVKIIAKNNQLIVGRDDDLYQNQFMVEKLNWLTRKPALKAKILVQVRYLQSPIKAKIKLLDQNQAKIKVDRAIRAIAPGQSAVFYQKNKLLGRGIIIDK